MTIKQNPFKVFNIPISFKIDETLLDKKFMEMQKAYHPDTNTSDVEMSFATSESYHALKNDITRGDIILKIFNIDQNTFPMPKDFFSEVLEITERMEEVSERDARIILGKEGTNIKRFDKITQQNINNFAKAFIRYKYIKKAFINAYGS